MNSYRAFSNVFRILCYLFLYCSIRKITEPFLIIAPSSTIGNWSKEFEKFCPSLKCLSLVGNKAARVKTKKLMKKREKWDVCLSSYEMAMKEKVALSKYTWSHIVIDEAQRVKNENTALAKHLRKFKSKFRILLSGTPVQVS